MEREWKERGANLSFELDLSLTTRNDMIGAQHQLVRSCFLGDVQTKVAKFI